MKDYEELGINANKESTEKTQSPQSFKFSVISARLAEDGESRRAYSVSSYKIGKNFLYN